MIFRDYYLKKIVKWLILYFTKETYCLTPFSMLEWFETQLLIDFFSSGGPYYSTSYCLTSIMLGRFYFFMEWCIERFLVKIVSVAEIGVLKSFVKGNQSLFLCNHTLTHFLPNFTVSPSYRSNADSIERGTGWGDFFLYDGKLYVG